jgi:hypothetical protein
VRQCGPGLLISTFLRIASEPLGFDTQNVYVTDVALPFHDIEPSGRKRASLTTSSLV